MILRSIISLGGTWMVSGVTSGFLLWLSPKNAKNKPSRVRHYHCRALPGPNQSGLFNDVTSVERMHSDRKLSG